MSISASAFRKVEDCLQNVTQAVVPEITPILNFLTSTVTVDPDSKLSTERFLLAMGTSLT